MHEIKHDGFRILAREEGQRVTPFRGASGRWWLVAGRLAYGHRYVTPAL